jgi:hypothetical protein
MRALASGLRWLWENIDPVAALVLAVVFSVLGVFGVIGQEVLSNVVLATLAVIAFTLLRERTAAGHDLVAVSDSLERRLSEVDGSIAQIREAIGMMSTLIKPTQGRFLTHDFEQAILDTSLWIYKGGTGTYLRAVTLPGNAENAVRRRTRREIWIEILDPGNVELCDRYGRMRRSLDPKPDKTGETWTTRRVRNESYATILAAAYYRERHGLLDIQLGLSSTMSLFRYDLSSQYIIITQEDGTAPALEANSGTYFYNSYLNELRLSFEQSRVVDLQRAQDIPLTRNGISAHEVSRLFQALGVPLDDSVEQKDLDSIVEKAFRPVNLYG